MELAILIVCILLLGVSLYGNYNLMKQNEVLEDQVTALQDVLDEIKDQVVDINTRLTEIDIKGSFEADDEVGFVFKEIREMANELSDVINEMYE
jgi:methyl-accepting chemotaxis protein